MALKRIVSVSVISFLLFSCNSKKEENSIAKASADFLSKCSYHFPSGNYTLKSSLISENIYIDSEIQFLYNHSFNFGLVEFNKPEASYYNFTYADGSGIVANNRGFSDGQEYVYDNGGSNAFLTQYAGGIGKGYFVYPRLDYLFFDHFALTSIYNDILFPDMKIGAYTTVDFDHYKISSSSYNVKYANKGTDYYLEISFLNKGDFYIPNSIFCSRVFYNTFNGEPLTQNTFFTYGGVLSVTSLDNYPYRTDKEYYGNRDFGSHDKRDVDNDISAFNYLNSAGIIKK